MPSTQTSAVPAGAKFPPGQYQLIGSVVAEVNGSPIYANKVLNLINKPLTQKARDGGFGTGPMLMALIGSRKREKKRA